MNGSYKRSLLSTMAGVGYFNSLMQEVKPTTLTEVELALKHRNLNRIERRENYLQLIKLLDLGSYLREEPTMLHLKKGKVIMVVFPDTNRLTMRVNDPKCKEKSYSGSESCIEKLKQLAFDVMP